MQTAIYYLRCPVCLIFRNAMMMMMMLSCLCAQTWAASGTNELESTFVTLRFKNAYLEDVLLKIQEQSAFNFSFGDEIQSINGVSINVKEKSLSTVLKTLSSEAGVSFHKVGKMIAVIKKSFHSALTPIDTNKSSFIQISGKVTDAESGEPMAGVNVVVKGTTQGTITDIEGKYEISVDEQAVLIFSFVGYVSQEMPVGSRSSLDIQLLPDQKQIDEVVVVGYGVQKKASLTSAVSTVKTEEFKDAPYTDITAALAGRAAGVIVNSSGGEPGSVPDISIRGGEPLIKSTAPLYVIDGIIRDRGTFVALNINDIASISFLKDAASTAVFGAQATGGIVLVTTKSGGAGKPELEYSGNFSYNTPSLFPKLINSYDKALVANAIGEQQGNGKNSVYSSDDLEAIRTGSNPDKYPNTDWYKLAFKSFAQQQTHNLSLNGGSKLTKYYIGFGMLTQGSNYVNNAQVYKRYSYNSRITNTFEGTGLTLIAGLNGYLTNGTAPPFSAGDIFSHVVATSPLQHAFNKNGSLAGLVQHPLSEIYSPGYARKQTFFADGNVTLKWEVPWVKGLSARVLFDYSTTISNERTFTAYAPQYNADGTPYQSAKPSLSDSTYFARAYNNEFQLDYNRNFGEHGFGASLVAIARAGKLSWNTASRKNFPSAAVDQMFAGDASTQVNGGSSSEWGNVGFVGRLKYDYALKYLIEITGRYDGSDFFPPDKRFGLFPAISASWVVSSEKFYRDLGLQKVFSELKFRASYGRTGAVGDPKTKYAYVQKYAINSNTFVSGGSLSNGYSEGDLTRSNQNITWYATTSTDLAMDFVTLNRHLSGTFDYFDTQTKNILGSPAYRYVEPLGKKMPQVLTEATAHKRGFDASLRYDFTVNKNLKGYAGFNCTYFNYLWKISNEDSVKLANPYSREQGINQDYNRDTNKDHSYAIYQSLGLYQSYEQILNNPWSLGATQLAPGDVWLADTNGDGKIDGEDFRRLGKAKSPQFVFGIPLGFTFKNLTVDVLLQGTGRRDVYLGNLLQGGEGLHRINFDFQKDFWTLNNTGSSYPRAATNSSNSGNNYQASTFWLKNAQYLRLKSVTVAYDLSPYIRSVKFIKHFSLHFSGTNLLTWSPVSKYFDPELGDSNNFFYPVNKTWSIGLRARF